jgi:hypothetical protein
MNTDHATLVLASSLRSPRRFRRFDLSKSAQQRLAAIQQLLETFDKLTFASDFDQALARLNEAYRLLDVEPPPADSASLTSRKHPMLFAFDNPHPDAEKRMPGECCWFSGEKRRRTPSTERKTAAARSPRPFPMMCLNPLATHRQSHQGKVCRDTAPRPVASN